MKQRPIWEAYCEDCDTVPPRDEEKSTENWHVFPVICPLCGGKIKLRVL